MKLTDLIEAANPTSIYKKSVEGYQDLDSDNSQVQKVNTRKTRLTLLQINKMRKMNDIRNIEYKERIKVIQQQYGPDSAVSDDIDF